MTAKPSIYFSSNVFLKIASNEKISKKLRDRIKELWDKLNLIANCNQFNGRFPEQKILREEIEYFKPSILACHLSHPISADLIKNSELFAIATSTAGYNHIERTDEDNILITHTPGVLHHTVADYTIAMIMSNLRNIVNLHNYVWNEEWKQEDKWDLDQSLSSVIDNKTLGIVGLGEIGIEVVRRLYPWGLKIIYYDLNQSSVMEEEFPNIEYKSSMEEIFKEADIVSLHIPLNKHTEKQINKDLLTLMKSNSLLVNTARGGIIDFDDLLDLLENKELSINLSFDVYPEEPIQKYILIRLKKILEKQPDLRFLLMPHNASADADTRGKMVIIILEDIIQILESEKVSDLTGIHIIPEHRKQLNSKKWKIEKYWGQK